MHMLVKPLIALLMAIGLTVGVAGLAGCKTAENVSYDYPSGRGGGGP